MQVSRVYLVFSRYQVILYSVSRLQKVESIWLLDA